MNASSDNVNMYGLDYVDCGCFVDSVGGVVVH